MPDDPVSLGIVGGGQMLLRVEQFFHHEPHPRFPGEWKVSTDGYAYRVRYSEEPEEQLFAWHWHPKSRPDCHLHLSASHASAHDLHRRHIPTGRVSFEEVILFLIAEFNVRPRRKRYLDMLGDSLTRFETYRSWAGSRKP